MTAWMEIAEGELGQCEVPGAGDNPRIREYHASASDGAEMPDATPWCASFAGWVLQTAGIEGSGSRMARSYLKWGSRLDMPREGCIVVLRRGSDPNAGHVGFFHSRKNGRVFLLGGNQGDKVSIQGFPEDQVLGYRWPNEAAAPPPQPSKEEHMEAHEELIDNSLWYGIKRWFGKLLGGGSIAGAGASMFSGLPSDPVTIALLLLGVGLAVLVGIEVLQFLQRNKLMRAKT